MLHYKLELTVSKAAWVSGEKHGGGATGEGHAMELLSEAAGARDVVDDAVDLGHLVDDA